MKDVALSIVLPVYNEGKLIKSTLEVYLAVLPKLVNTYELVVVNDGSTDETTDIVENASRTDERIRVVNNARNYGQAISLLIGFRRARGEIVTHNGCDLPFDPQETRRLLEAIREGADLVVVERQDRGAYGFVRLVMSRANCFLLRQLLGSPFRDHNFVQAFRRELIVDMPLRTTGVSTILPELILKSRMAGANIRTISSAYHRRRAGRSTINSARVLHTMKELYYLYFELRLWRKEMELRRIINEGCAARK